MAEERLQRRLAAILSADVVGYSRLMGVDEAGTLSRLNALRRELIDPAIAAHSGRIVKLMGDGALVEFASAVDAVTCAIEIQRQLRGRDAGGSEADPIRFRIGINVGDIIIEGDDILGDGVNIAARIEGVAEPGGISLSEDAWRQVQGKVTANFVDSGEHNLKNIARPVRVYRIALGGEDTIHPSATAPSIPDKPSIAVLPFQNMSGDPEQEYFADGMVEDIISALSRFKSLFVIARNSSFTFKGKAVDIKQIGRELGVGYVLEGSVRKAANKVRITGQLIEAATGAHLWADKFDGTLDDVFELQDNITASVAGAITSKISNAEVAKSARKPAENWASYDHYLRGLDLQSKRSREGTIGAIAQFKKAIELDPMFGLAYAHAALTMNSLRYLFQHHFAKEDCDEALFLASRAIDLAPDDGFVLAYCGLVFGDMAGDFERGASLADRAISLNPNLAAAWNIKGWMYLRLGEAEIAMTAFDQAVRLNPLDQWLIPIVWRGKANACSLIGQYDQGIAWAEMLLAQSPSDLPGLWALWANHSLAGNCKEAVDAASRLRAAYPQLHRTALKELLHLRKPEHTALIAELISRLNLPD
jgi:adenylate cyclase